MPKINDTIQLQERPLPATPAAGLLDLFGGTDHRLHLLDPNGIESVIGPAYAATVGNGAATSFVITHNLNTRDVVVQVYDASSPFGEKTVLVERTSVNTVTVYFDVAPATNSRRVVVGYGSTSPASGLAYSLADIRADAGPSNTAAETTLFSIPLPTTLLSGDVIKWTAAGDMRNNSAGGLTFQAALKVGASVMQANAISVANASGRRPWRMDGELLVVNPANDQRLSVVSSFGNSTGNGWTVTQSSSAGNAYIGVGYAAFAEDLTAVKNFLLTMTMGSAQATTDFLIHDATFILARR